MQKRNEARDAQKKINDPEAWARDEKVRLDKKDAAAKAKAKRDALKAKKAKEEAQRVKSMNAFCDNFFKHEEAAKANKSKEEFEEWRKT